MVPLEITPSVKVRLPVTLAAPPETLRLAIIKSVKLTWTSFQLTLPGVQAWLPSVLSNTRVPAFQVPAVAVTSPATCISPPVAVSLIVPAVSVNVPQSTVPPFKSKLPVPVAVIVKVPAPVLPTLTVFELAFMLAVPEALSIVKLLQRAPAPVKLIS